MRNPWPDRVLQASAGVGTARVLLAAVEVGLFTELGHGPRTPAQLLRRLALHPSAAPDFLDALVSLGFLEREGDDAQVVYVNTRESGHYLDARSPAYLGRWLRDAHAGGDEVAAWLRGHPGATPVDAARRACALEGEAALLGDALAQRVDFRGVRTLLDVQGAAARLACALAAAQPRMSVLTLEHDGALARARAHIDASRFGARVRAAALSPGNWPRAEVIVLNGWLHASFRPDAALWRARAALADGGRVLWIDHLLDDARRHSAAAWLAILGRRTAGEPAGATTAQTARSLCAAAGFAGSEVLPLLGGASVVQAWI
jgi:hypothetical protein